MSLGADSFYIIEARPVLLSQPGVAGVMHDVMVGAHSWGGARRLLKVNERTNEAILTHK